MKNKITLKDNSFYLGEIIKENENIIKLRISKNEVLIFNKRNILNNTLIEANKKRGLIVPLLKQK